MNEISSIGEETVKVPEAAQILDMPERTVRHYCDVGELVAYKLGRTWRIEKDSIAELLRRRRNVPPDYDM